jgi:hypothetical protein
MHRKDEEHSGMEAIVHEHGIIKLLKRNLQHSGSLSIRKGLELTIYHPNSTVLLGLAINSLTLSTEGIQYTKISLDNREKATVL